MKYKVTITKTANGEADYMQIISADRFTTNIVLIGEFEVRRATDKPSKQRGAKQP